MLQPAETSSPKSTFSPNPNFYTTPKTAVASLEQATIGRSVVIKGEVTGAEPLYVDGRIEGTVNMPESRVTIGRNGTVAANITAREVVIMGKVTGNIQCGDRLDIRGEGSLVGDVNTQRISVEDGAVLKGSIQVRATENKSEKPNQAKPVSSETGKSALLEQPKVAAAAAGH